MCLVSGVFTWMLMKSVMCLKTTSVSENFLFSCIGLLICYKEVAAFQAGCLKKHLQHAWHLKLLFKTNVIWFVTSCTLVFAEILYLYKCWDITLQNSAFYVEEVWWWLMCIVLKQFVFGMFTTYLGTHDVLIKQFWNYFYHLKTRSCFVLKEVAPQSLR